MKINNQILFTGVVSASAIMTGCNVKKVNLEETNEQPNILCIVCEDISPLLGCFGDTLAYTPNIDKLAKEGVRFTNMFSVSGVSAPSRAALITGMYPTSFGADNMRTSRNDLPDNIPSYEAVPDADVKCYTEYMRAEGYYCTNNEKTDYQFKPPITAWDENGQTAHWKNRPEGKPFFSIFNIMTSHESQIWSRRNDPVVIPPENVNLPPYYPDDPDIRKDISALYSNITFMDREVGEYITELEKEGLLDKTIIIFYSDNGGPLPRQKREIYDSGLKVPFIIWFPDKKHAGEIVDDLVSFVDIPATILSLANVPIPDYMHGQAFWGKQKAKPREYVYAARDRMDLQYDTRRAVRDKRFKYIRNYYPEISCYQDIEYRKNLASMQALLRLRDEGKLDKNQMYWFRQTKKAEELYDIINDPFELNNLAENQDYLGELVRLRNVNDKWIKDMNDRVMMTEKELVWSMWPEGVQPITLPPVISERNDTIRATCETEGASIAYQVNGKGYNEDHWFLYTKPFVVGEEDVVSAVAIRIGYRQSDEARWE